jgi:hypothetical protein
MIDAVEVTPIMPKQAGSSVFGDNDSATAANRKPLYDDDSKGESRECADWRRDPARIAGFCGASSQKRSPAISAGCR